MCFFIVLNQLDFVQSGVGAENSADGNRDTSLAVPRGPRTCSLCLARPQGRHPSLHPEVGTGDLKVKDKGRPSLYKERDRKF